MKRISSTWTVYYKWAFPVLWFGFLAWFLFSASVEAKEDADPMIFIVPIAMMIFGGFLMKKMLWDLVDEVYDCGDELLFRSRGREERVKLSNIINVNESTNQSPPRITLRLDNPSKSFGKEIAFCPPLPAISFNPWAKSKVGEDLIVRVDRARAKRAV